jgi:DNA-binding MarR family transcriptional regulator/GNAT superfamily N-acetyltransferase
MDAGQAAGPVRDFNRFYTNAFGLLRGGLLETPHPLTEARVLFELGQSDATEVASLRSSLDVDPGYLSRILARLERGGLVTKKPSGADRRRRVVGLTARGRAHYETLDRRSTEQVAGMLAGLTDHDRHRLIASMTTIRALLAGRSSSSPVVLRPPVSGDFGWVIERHGALYFEEYGWNEQFEALVARIVADYVAAADPRQAAWIAESGGERVGCVFSTARDERVAQLRLLLVDPRARGLGIGGRLVDECIGFARRSGYERMTLWTNDVLTAARRLYERSGFELGDEEPHHSFGRDLVGQNWWLDL